MQAYEDSTIAERWCGLCLLVRGRMIVPQAMVYDEAGPVA